MNLSVLELSLVTPLIPDRARDDMTQIY